MLAKINYIVLALLISGSHLGAMVYYFAGTGHWYEPVLVSEGIVWTNAYMAATNSGGYLCTVTNAAENDFAASLVDASYYSDFSINGDILGPWLGGFRLANNSQWQWVTGEPFVYTDWYANQPDGYGGSDQKLQYYARATIGATWGDHPGDSIPGYSLPRGYIIEYDRPPLVLSASNNIVAVTWPAAATNWVLETTPSLAPATWNLVTNNQYQFDASHFFMTVTNPVGMAFFRLRSN